MKHACILFSLVEVLSLELVAKAHADSADSQLLAAACYSAKRVVEISAALPAITRQVTLEGNVQSIGTVGNEILATSGSDLIGIHRSDFTVDSWRAAIGNSPNHIYTEGRFVYVVNSLTPNVLKIFERDPNAEGETLLPRSQIDFGPNTSPQAIAKIGDYLFVPFFGAISGGPGRVAKVDVSDPTNPSVVEIYDLSGVDLHSFEGIASSAYPSGVVARNDAIYVSLANLVFEPSSFSLRPGGPGIMVRIDVTTGGLASTDLGAKICLNAYWVAASEDRVYVGCAGRVVYDESFKIVSVDSSGVVAVDLDGAPIGSWNPTCDETECIPPSIGRVVARGNSVFAADQSGRVFSAELTEGQLVERWGYHSVDGTPSLMVCPAAGFVADLISLPE